MSTTCQESRSTSICVCVYLVSKHVEISGTNRVHSMSDCQVFTPLVGVSISLAKVVFPR